MEKKSMTALVSSFARAYHAEHNQVKIFDDRLAREMLTDQEWEMISYHMSQSIAFFQPDFSGSQQEALRTIVDRQLSPSPLGRAAFTETALEAAAALGATQYLIFAAGYDTFAYRQPEWASKLRIFEIDHPATAADKRERLKAIDMEVPSNVHYVSADFRDSNWADQLLSDTAFDPGQVSFSSLLGISYYLPRDAFKQLLSDIASLVPSGSSFAFDYPDEHTFSPSAGDRARKQVMIAAQAGEPMQACYSYRDLEHMLEDEGLLIYEHLTPSQITERLFKAYNDSTPAHPITAFDNVNYCLAVKR